MTFRQFIARSIVIAVAGAFAGAFIGALALLELWPLLLIIGVGVAFAWAMVNI